MLTKRICMVGAAGVALAVIAAAACSWRFYFGPNRMVAAIQRGDAQKISTLVHLGINPDADAYLVGGLMHCAAASGQAAALARLHDLGADVNRLDGYGVAPLHVAVQHQRLDSFRWLLAHGADPSLPDREGRTVSVYIRDLGPVEQRELFAAELEKAGAAPTARNGALPDKKAP